jgi:hypothetical protein
MPSDEQSRETRHRNDKGSNPSPVVAGRFLLRLFPRRNSVIRKKRGVLNIAQEGKSNREADFKSKPNGLTTQFYHFRKDERQDAKTKPDALQESHCGMSAEWKTNVIPRVTMGLIDLLIDEGANPFQTKAQPLGIVLGRYGLTPRDLCCGHL